MKWIEPERFYTVYETAAILNVSRDMVLRLSEKGHLPAMKYPRAGGRGRNVKRMILGRDIIRFIEESKAA